MQHVRPRHRMFLTHTSAELPAFFAPELPETRCWRALRLTAHQPWLFATVLLDDEGLQDTFCLAWDTDLLELLRGAVPARLVGLLIMLPGWASPTGQWGAVAIKQVWVADDKWGVEWAVFRDDENVDRICGLDLEPPPSLTNWRLMFEL